MAAAAPRVGRGRFWPLLPAIAVCLAAAYAVVGAVVYAVLFLRPYMAPSASMAPTLQIGDCFFAFAYAQPPAAGQIAYGDVLVFKHPRDSDVEYVKRVVGLPGDRIQVKNGVLHVNAKPVTRQQIQDFELPIIARVQQRYRQYVETLHDGQKHLIIEISDQEARSDDTPLYAVPPGHLFVLGDNRDQSQDSRFLNDVGYVPLGNVTGKVSRIFFSVDGAARWWQIWRWPASIRYDRLFMAVT